MNDMNSPKNLSGLIDIQDGSVVSKTLLKKGAGSVTLFAFDAGQELSEHAAPYEALVMAIEGSAEITIAGERHPVKEGDILSLPARVPHGLSASEPFKMLLIMIRDPE